MLAFLPTITAHADKLVVNTVHQLLALFQLQYSVLELVLEGGDLEREVYYFSVPMRNKRIAGNNILY